MHGAFGVEMCDQNQLDHLQLTVICFRVQFLVHVKDNHR